METTPVEPVRTALNIKRYENKNGTAAWILHDGIGFVKSFIPEGENTKTTFVGWQENQTASLEEILDHMQTLLSYSELTGEQCIRAMHIACKILNQLGLFPDYVSEDEIDIKQREQRIRQKQQKLAADRMLGIGPPSVPNGTFVTLKSRNNNTDGLTFTYGSDEPSDGSNE